MSFFYRSNHRRRNRDYFIFGIGLAALAGVIYVFFFCPIKRLTPLEPSQPVPSTTKAAAETIPSMPPQTATAVPAFLPAYHAWISSSEKADPNALATSFFPHEKIYLHVTFPQLAAGIARVNVNWISPLGKQSNSAEQIISQVNAETAAISFWLLLAPNGPVAEIFTGSEYKSKAYGQWQAQVFFNGEPLTTLPFCIHE